MEFLGQTKSKTLGDNERGSRALKVQDGEYVDALWSPATSNDLSRRLYKEEFRSDVNSHGTRLLYPPRNEVAVYCHEIYCGDLNAYSF